MNIASYPPQPRKVNYDWFSESFQIFMRDFGVWIFAVITFAFLLFGLSFALQRLFQVTGYPTSPEPGGSFSVAALFNPNYRAYLAVSQILGIPLNAFFTGSLFRMANKSVRGRRLSFSDAFSGGPTFVQFLIFSIFIAIASWVGFFACVVGSFVVIGLFYPAFSLLADGEKCSVAIAKSFNGMKADWLNATCLSFLFSVLYVLSCCCCIGEFVTAPMAIITVSLACRDMIGLSPGPSNFDPSPTIPGSSPPPPTA